MYAAIIIQTELTKQVWEVTGRVTVQCTRNNSYQNIACARGHVVMHPDCFLLEHVRAKVAWQTDRDDHTTRDDHRSKFLAPAHLQESLNKQVDATNLGMRGFHTHS